MGRDRQNALTGVTGEAIRFVFRHPVAYAIFFALSLVAGILIETLFAEELIVDKSVNVFGLEISAVTLILNALATAFVAVPLHNFIIKGSTAYLPRHTGRLLVFALLEAMLALLTVLAFSILVNSVTDSSDVFFALLLFAVSMAFGVTLTTVLPHLAVTPLNEFGLSEPISLAEGRRFPILIRFLLLTVLLGMINVGCRSLLPLLPFQLPPEDTIVGWYAPVVLEGAWYSATAILFVTLASMIYLRLSERDDALISNS